MPSPSHSPFGDVLLCPVCMVVFEGRILQCSQGHAVCEACQLKLTECPHCRGVYVGTRNYVLEQVIAKLKLLRTTDNINWVDQNDDAPGETKSTNEAPEDLLLSEATQSDGASASESAATVKILAPKGLYDCRMDTCNAKLPFCRLLNHLRYFHKDSLIETNRTTNTNEDGDFVDHWSLPCVTFQKCFHLHNFGIFFLIVNVTQPDGPDAGRTNIKAWVQCAYPNRVARNFRFSLELLMGNMVATFTDYVVGAQSDSTYIQANNNCLNVDTAEHYEKVTIEMKISRTLGAQNLPRNYRTDCRLLPVTTPSSGTVENEASRRRPR
ncbi:hypothetical protein HA402_010374 [Bradysia odoriphaga]|nr:hypothetical protein HA402_010374 [Bradysia odoriphaga]